MLEDKIHDLFEYRRIPEMIALSGEIPKSMLATLKLLQIAIYELDEVLEQNWDVQENRLDEKWAVIRNRLEVFQLSTRSRENLLKQIVRYQRHEVDMRKGLSPVRFSPKHLYYYKSCDVRLIRRLLYHMDPGLKQIIKPIHWNCFDYITEVNDDIQDIFEDCLDFNGNLFIFLLAQKGLLETKLEFGRIIKEIKTMNDLVKAQSSDFPYLQNLAVKTSVVIDETNELFVRRMTEISMDQIKTSKVIEAFMFQLIQNKQKVPQ